jgi:hypothetical protein
MVMPNSARDFFPERCEYQSAVYTLSRPSPVCIRQVTSQPSILHPHSHKLLNLNGIPKWHRDCSYRGKPGSPEISNQTHGEKK